MTSTPLPVPPPIDPTGTARPSRAPLQRTTTGKMLGGVCGGLAEHTGIDVLLWRIGFVALTLAGGSGVLVYLLLWVLMPSAPVGPADTRSALDDLVDRLHAAISGSRVTR